MTNKYNNIRHDILVNKHHVCNLANYVALGVYLESYKVLRETLRAVIEHQLVTEWADSLNSYQILCHMTMPKTVLTFIHP